jgi:hypothetical protein
MRRGGGAGAPSASAQTSHLRSPHPSRNNHRARPEAGCCWGGAASTRWRRSRAAAARRAAAAAPRTRRPPRRRAPRPRRAPRLRRRRASCAALTRSCGGASGRGATECGAAVRVKRVGSLAGAGGRRSPGAARGRGHAGRPGGAAVAAAQQATSAASGWGAAGLAGGARQGARRGGRALQARRGRHGAPARHARRPAGDAGAFRGVFGRAPTAAAGERGCRLDGPPSCRGTREAYERALRGRPPHLAHHRAAAPPGTMALASRTKAFAGARAAPAPSARAVRLVVRASAQKQQQAKPSFELPAAVRPALATVVANVIMAMPAAAEAGELPGGRRGRPLAFARPDWSRRRPGTAPGARPAPRRADQGADGPRGRPIDGLGTLRARYGPRRARCGPGPALAAASGGGCGAARRRAALLPRPRRAAPPLRCGAAPARRRRRQALTPVAAAQRARPDGGGGPARSKQRTVGNTALARPSHPPPPRPPSRPCPSPIPRQAVRLQR